MAEHNELGKQGEAFAKQYLLDKGYKIIETNWRSGHLEIDIIARKYDFISIIEVKTRASNDFGFPEEFVDKKKMKHLIKAAEKYVLKNNIEQGVRFEIIALTKSANGFETEHFEEAFDPASISGGYYSR
jgi:putative endonuclease